MKTRVLSAEAPEAIKTALQVLASGGLIVFPTDTLYGVACAPYNRNAIARLYEAKARPRSLAIPLLVADHERVAAISTNLPDSFDAAAARFWPGALTLIVPRNERVPDILCAGRASVAVRMPDHPVALELLRRAGGLLAVTSANRSGAASTATAQDALADLDARVELVLDGGPCPGAIPSTIVDLTVSPPRLLRSGAIDLASLHEVWPQLGT